MGSFVAQFSALCRKNWIILWRYKWINLVRCLILPICYAVFFAKAQDFFVQSGVLGPGHIAPLNHIPPEITGRKIVWSPPAAANSNTTLMSFSETLISRAMEGVTGPVIKVANNTQLEKECPANFASLSECFAAVVFTGINPDTHVLNYTLRGDLGLIKINVDDASKDDVSSRVLPLQWAIESNFIEMTTGTAPASPYSWEYTQQTQADLDEQKRISYLNGIRSLIVLAFFLVFLGVVYQLPGSMASERANSLTSHLEAMGCRKSARFISWHLSISSAYLVAWIVVAVVWQKYIFSGTDVGLFIVLYVLTGLSLASWTQLVSIPFSGSPTLAAITATFVAIVLAIAALIIRSGSVIQVVLTLIFPPMFYTFFTKNLTAWEVIPRHPQLLRRSPRGDAPLLALLIIAIIDIVLFPLLAVWLESKIYGVRPPNQPGWLKRLFGKSGDLGGDVPPGTAVRISNMRKLYSTKTLGFLGWSKPVVAIEDLSFSVPKGEIFCLLGRNGAAKSTTLSAIAKTLNFTSGRISYAEDLHIGIASQKDVLWDQLTCKQHIALWRAIKTTKQHYQDESDLDLLARCDLGPKVSFLSQNLSGGQKRKLQLACALAGGSNLLLLDEISSGLDPLSRRAIWKLITANRGSSTIILTTHFLDEADYLGDSVAILQAPGKLLALDNPVALKTRLGRGYTLAVDSKNRHGNLPLLEELRKDAPGITTRPSKGKELYLTGSTDLGLLRRLVARMQGQRGEQTNLRYQINSATLEEVFLDLNTTPSSSENSRRESISLEPILASRETATPSSASAEEKNLGAYDDKNLEVVNLDDRASDGIAKVESSKSGLALTSGHKRNFFLSIPIDAFTIFQKRLIVLRKSWILPLTAIVVVICGCCIPLFFMKDRVQTCEAINRRARTIPMTYPYSTFPTLFPPLILAPQAAFNASGVAPYGLFTSFLPNNQSFVQLFQGSYKNLSFGGVSLASEPTTPSLFAWEGSILLNKGLSSLNILTNAVLNQITPVTGGPQFRINLGYRALPSPSFLSTAEAMKWIAFFGLAVAVWPAFGTIYPTAEKASNVRANQYSNGASPAALWLGHILFDLPSILLISTIVTILFGTLSSQFNYLGMVWICFVLYGISGTLWAYLMTLGLKSALASWAVVAGFNVITFLLYLAAYLLILTYDRAPSAGNHLTITHFTGALISPVPSIVRTILVSINLFSLLCDGLGNRTTKPPSDILQFGGPILYFVLQSIIAFSLLVWIDSGAPLPSILRLRHNRQHTDSSSSSTSPDVVEERERIERGSTDQLQVKGLRKRYPGASNIAVDDVSFGVHLGDTFALIGPNGAGKTTTLACIRGVERPNTGDITVAGHSITKARNQARAYLGVCPQVNAIDYALTVRQHLWLYGRLKGVPSKPLKQDVEALLSAAGLMPKANALASSLSGGNQRKLALAIALIGDREVVLIDEFSSGVDPFSKREAWQTLASLTRDRAVVMTTHSMEEVDALASRVGIIASKMLAVGTPSTLKSRFATYEIHLSSTHVQPVLEYFQSHGFPSAHRSLDTLTRISVPGVREDDTTRLLQVLHASKEEVGVNDEEIAIQEASTETAFLSIVREHNIQEEERHEGRKRGWWAGLFKRGGG